MALDPSKAIPGTVTVESGGDERGGGNYPTMDAGRPITYNWEEISGTTGGVTTTDISAVGVGVATVAESTDGPYLTNGLCDIEFEGSQGVKIARVTVVGCGTTT